MKKTPLFDLHNELGARMVPFAGYDMPVQYPDGILREHLHTREHAGLFDVSHMGQVLVRGKGAGAALERLVPADLESLPVGRQTYSLLMNEAGGIRDDLIITRWGPDEYFVVVNAGCKDADIAYLRAQLGSVQVEELGTQALLAFQGPAAVEVIGALAPELSARVFMSGMHVELAGVRCYVTRSGYTGEDGFEISVPDAASVALARQLLASERVKPIGLGARDSLRLEAGLCLYGHDLNETTTPVAASLQWAIAKARRPDGERAGGFPGAEIVFAQLRDGVPRKRVGLRGDGKTPVREGAELLNATGTVVGTICSGGFGPTVGGPVAMSYITSADATPGTQLQAMVRDKPRPMSVCKMPFVPQRYYRG